MTPIALVSVDGSLQPSSAAPTIPLASTSSVYATHPHLDKQAEVSIGVAVPIAALGMLSLAILLWRRSRTSSKANGMIGEEEASEGNQPYLQRKAELEGEEKWKFELDAVERRHELDGENEIHEVPTETNERGTPCLAIRQELAVS